MRSDSGTSNNADFVLLRELVGLVLTQPTLSDALQRAAELIAADVPGADDVSVTFADGQPRTIAFSGDLALRADEYQYDADAGPCLAAMHGGKRVLVEDLESDHRWPDYASRALVEGVR